MHLVAMLFFPSPLLTVNESRSYTGG